MKLIRVPIWDSEAKNNDEAKDLFVNNLKELIPESDEERLKKMWDIYNNRKILQLLININDTSVIATMYTIGFETAWQINSEFLKSVPNVNEYLENSDLEDYFQPEQNSSNKNNKRKLSKSEIDEKLDKILDELVEVGGFDKLSKEKQDFLNKFSNKHK